MQRRNYRRLKVERLFQWQLDCLKHEGARPFREAANLVYTAPTGCGTMSFQITFVGTVSNFLTQARRSFVNY